MDFISLPVTVGFTAAAAFTIASAQIKNFLGLKVKSSNEVVDSWYSVMTNLDKISWPDTLLGCGTIVALLLGRVNKSIYHCTIIPRGSGCSFDNFMIVLFLHV